MLYMPSRIPSKVFASILLVLMAFMTSIEQGQAKRGCASFGHSCFGGHGKRAAATAAVSPGDPEEIPVGVQRPNDAFAPEGSLPQMEIFSRDEGQLDANGLNLYLKQQKYRDPDEFAQLASFLRKWLNRRQEMSADK